MKLVLIPTAVSTTSWRSRWRSAPHPSRLISAPPFSEMFQLRRAAANLGRVLHATGAPTPLRLGASAALGDGAHVGGAAHAHGVDGLWGAGALLPAPPTAPTGDAIAALEKRVADPGPDARFLGVGPATNLARALQGADATPDAPKRHADDRRRAWPWQHHAARRVQQPCRPAGAPARFDDGPDADRGSARGLHDGRAQQRRS